MSNKDIYNIGTTVYYEGDDINDRGFGTITAQTDSYLGELSLEITLADGRTICNVTPADFEGKTVLGNRAIPEFYLADGEVIRELEGYKIDEEEFGFLSY